MGKGVTGSFVVEHLPPHGQRGTTSDQCGSRMQRCKTPANLSAVVAQAETKWSNRSPSRDNPNRDDSSCVDGDASSMLHCAKMRGDHALRYFLARHPLRTKEPVGSNG